MSRELVSLMLREPHDEQPKIFHVKRKINQKNENITRDQNHEIKHLKAKVDQLETMIMQLPQKSGKSGAWIDLRQKRELTELKTSLLDGIVDGINNEFMISSNQDTKNILIHKNGILMHEGTENDFTRDGKMIKFITTPRAGSTLLVTGII